MIRIHISASINLESASQNEAALKNLLYGQILANLVPFLVRLLYRALGRGTSIKIWILSAIATGISQLIYGRLAALGKPRRDANGMVVSAGADLNQPGVTEWMFDVLYISCACSPSYIYVASTHRPRGCPGR